MLCQIHKGKEERAAKMLFCWTEEYCSQNSVKKVAIDDNCETRIYSHFLQLSRNKEKLTTLISPVSLKTSDPVWFRALNLSKRTDREKMWFSKNRFLQHTLQQIIFLRLEGHWSSSVTTPSPGAGCATLFYQLCPQSFCPVLKNGK